MCYVGGKIKLVTLFMNYGFFVKMSKAFFEKLTQILFSISCIIELCQRYNKGRLFVCKFNNVLRKLLESLEKLDILA